jgi:preprotein translocase subunit SecY
MPPPRVVALVAVAAVLAAVAVAWGIGSAIVLLVLVVVMAGVVYSLATVGDWMHAWGRRSGDLDRRR